LITIIFSVFLFGGCGIALWKGRASERLTAILLLAAAFVSPLVAMTSFMGPELGILAVDAALFAFLILLAMVSDRFWPMWAAAFQIVGTLIHVARFVDVTIWPNAYATAEAFWAYPVLLALAVGTWFEARFRVD